MYEYIHIMLTDIVQKIAKKFFTAVQTQYTDQQQLIGMCAWSIVHTTQDTRKSQRLQHHQQQQGTSTATNPHRHIHTRARERSSVNHYMTGLEPRQLTASGSCCCCYTRKLQESRQSGMRIAHGEVDRSGYERTCSTTLTLRVRACMCACMCVRMFGCEY